MKRALLLLCGALLATMPAHGIVLLNEIHIAPPGDTNAEYVELRSTSPGEYTTTNGLITGEPLTILLIDANGTSIGEVVEAWRLAYEVPGPTPGDPVQVIPYKTGTNYLLLLGDGYTSLPKGGPWSGLIEAATEVGDPKSPTTASPAGSAPLDAYSGMKAGNIKPNGGVNILLVAGYKGLTNRGIITEGVLKPLGDVDIGTSNSNTTNNNTYDWVDATRLPLAQATVPWTTLVDSVGYSEVGGSARVPYSGSATNVSLRTGVSASGMTPANLSRLRPTSPTNLTLVPNQGNKRDAWYGGTITGGAPETISFTAVFGGITGEATPGRQNRNTSKPVPLFLINELALNPPGIDGNFEYVEIINKTVDPETGEYYASLNDYALILVDSSGANIGRITNAYDLSKFSTGSNGLLLVGNNYAIGSTPWDSIIDPATHLADPAKPILNPTKWSNFGSNDLGDNNGFTLMLVKGYASAVATIDTVITNASGSALLTPSTYGTVKDMIGADELLVPFGSDVGSVSGAKSCAAAGKFALTVSGYTAPNNFYNPELMARKADSSVATSAAAWYGGKFGPRADPQAIGLANGFYFGGFKGEATPGRKNYSSTNLPVAGNVLLNEVHLFPPDGSGSNEYVEVINPAGGIVGMNGLSLVVLDAAAAHRGRINAIISLTGMSTGANGLAFFCDGVEEATNLWRVGGYLSPLTLTDDPVAYTDNGIPITNFNMGTDTLTPNNGLAVLIVKELLNTATIGQELDPDHNGVLDIKPWTSIIDSVGFGLSVDPSVTFLTITGYSPGNISRYNGNTTANSTGAWFGGQLKAYGNSLSDLTSTEYTANRFGTFVGSASPGRLNPTVPSVIGTSFLINEVSINPPGGDNDKEFIEIRNVANVAASTNGLTLLLIDSKVATSGTSNTGGVLKAFSLDGMGTGPNGLLLLGNNYTEVNRANIPWNGTTNTNGVYALKASPQTALGFPPGMTPDAIGEQSANGALSLLLVKNFNQREGVDLDSGMDAAGTVIGTPDDGVIDLVAWDQPILDAIGMKLWNTARVDVTGNALPPALEGTIYGGVDLSQPASLTSAGYTPDAVARYRSNNTPNNAGAWFGGNIAGTSGTSTTFDTSFPTGFPAKLRYFPQGCLGHITPGLPNTPTAAEDASDADKDGVPLLLEEAMGTNPNVNSQSLLPTLGTVQVTSLKFPTLTYRQLIGGSGPPGTGYSAQGFLYQVESSTNLQTWSSAGAELVGTAVDNGDGTQTVTVRSNTQYSPATPRQFLRLRATRN